MANTNRTNQNSANRPSGAHSSKSTTELQKDPTGGVRLNGFRQVLEMLRAADPGFRESLLRRIAVNDPQLAYSLREDL